MSTNDSLAQMPPLSQFDRAIMKALMKNPQGLRYCELLRKSEQEYERMGRGKGINVRTFDKHLKWLVSERTLERIVEARYRVYYRLTIPVRLKVHAEASRDLIVRVVNTLKQASAGRSQFPESLVEPLMEMIGYSVKQALLTGFELNQENPVWARYWVDEELETTRYFFNEITTIFGKQENIKDLLQLFEGLDIKWYEESKRDLLDLLK